MGTTDWSHLVTEVPALVVLALSLTWMFSRVLTAILDRQGKQIDRILDGFERLSDDVREMTRRCPIPK